MASAASRSAYPDTEVTLASTIRPVQFSCQAYGRDRRAWLLCPGLCDRAGLPDRWSRHAWRSIALAVEIDLGIAVVALFFVRRGLIRSRFTGRRYLLTLRCRLGIRTGGRRQLWPLVRGRCRLLRHKTFD